MLGQWKVGSFLSRCVATLIKLHVCKIVSVGSVAFSFVQHLYVHLFVTVFSILSRFVRNQNRTLGNQGRFPFTRSIRVEMVGSNIQYCSLSKYNVDKPQNVLVSVGKPRKNRKVHWLSRLPMISETFQMEWYVSVDFTTRISWFSVWMESAPSLRSLGRFVCKTETWVQNELGAKGTFPFYPHYMYLYLPPWHGSKQARRNCELILCKTFPASTRLSRREINERDLCLQGM